MSDTRTPTGQDPGPSAIFGGARKPERSGLSPVVWGVAALVVLIAVGALVLAGRRNAAQPPNVLQPEDAQARNLRLSQLAMSESESMSGVKVTYLDGHIHNAGQQTVTGATVQVLFANDEQMPPQINTLPVTLIRTREPYVDTEPLSAEPLKPGDDREFRLIFESVPNNWNTQMPQVRIIHTSLR